MCISWNNKKYFDTIDARCKHADGDRCFDSITSTNLICYLNNQLLKEDLASSTSVEIVKDGKLKTHSAALSSHSHIMV